MIPVMCIVQKGQISKYRELKLKFEICDFTQRLFSEDADIDWIEVPTGSGFTAAQPSTSLITSLQSCRSLDQSERTLLLKELHNICMNGAGRSCNEVTVAIRQAH